MKINNSLKEEIKILIQGILENRVGDILHLVNICTATSLYVNKDHPFIDNLSQKIGKLPISMGADLNFDILLRFSSAANLGIERFESSTLIVKNLGLDYNTTSIKTSYLVELWEKNPLLLCSNQLDTYMFGDYLAKLISNLNIQLSEKVKEGILHQMIAFIPSFHSNEYFQINKILYVLAQLTLGLRIANILVNERIANIYTNKLNDILERFEINQLIDLNRFSVNDLDNISYIGINLPHINNLSKISKEKCSAIVQDAWRKLNIDITEDYRRIALKISALKYFLSASQISEISSEFNLGHNLYFFLLLRNSLIKSYGLNYLLNQELKNDNIDLDNLTVQKLWSWLQGFEYKSGWNDIQSPVLTIKRRVGDCKSIVSLLSLILLQTKFRVNVCFYLGKYFNISEENHVYIEVYNRGKKIPLDITEKIGETHTCVKNMEAVISYPLSMLMKSDENDILTDILSQISMCQNRLKQ